MGAENAERAADERLTKLQQTRKSWDFIVAAHYYYGGPETGYRSVAKLFNMPMTTIRNIVDRTRKSDPETRHAALRFGLIRMNFGGFRGQAVIRQPTIDNILPDVL